MEQHDGPGRVRAFSPTGDEPADVEALYALLDGLGDLRSDPDVRRELVSIFERFPDADLGSPGPIVHALEKSPIDEHVELLASSLQRRATVMTVWMAERCFRSRLSERNRSRLLAALAGAREQSISGEVAEAIADALRKQGP
jgi:hypothetical protein